MKPVSFSEDVQSLGTVKFQFSIHCNVIYTSSIPY